jgi:hypothetical protein
LFPENVYIIIIHNYPMMFQCFPQQIPMIVIDFPAPDLLREDAGDTTAKATLKVLFGQAKSETGFWGDGKPSMDRDG